MTCSLNIKVGLDVIDVYLTSADHSKGLRARSVPTRSDHHLQVPEQEHMGPEWKPMVQSLIFRERREGNTDIREKHQPVTSHPSPDQGLNLQSGYVPCQRIEPTSFLVCGMMLQQTEPHWPG